MKTILMLLLISVTISCATQSEERAAESIEQIEDMQMKKVSSETPSKLVLHPKGTDSGELEGFQSINFGFDRSDLTAVAKEKLRSNAKWLEENPGLNLKIEGHCDPRGNAEYNLKLGKRRANAVLSYLLEIGVNPARLSTVSYGEESLLNPDSNSDNRRVNLLPIPR